MSKKLKLNVIHLFFSIQKASAYLKQQKYKDAEQLYREVLTAASEKDKPDDTITSSNVNSSNNLNTSNNKTQEKDYVVSGSWHKASKVDT